MKQWIDLKDVVSKLLTDHPEYEEMSRLYKANQNMDWQDRDCMNNIIKLKDVTSTEVQALIDLNEQVSKLGADADKKVAAFYVLYRLANGIDYSVKKEENELDKAYKAVIIKYPLVEFMREAEESQMKEFSRYINHIDKETK